MTCTGLTELLSRVGVVLLLHLLQNGIMASSSCLPSINGQRADQPRVLHSQNTKPVDTTHTHTAHSTVLVHRKAVCVAVCFSNHTHTTCAVCLKCECVNARAVCVESRRQCRRLLLLWRADTHSFHIQTTPWQNIALDTRRRMRVCVRVQQCVNMRRAVNG